MRQRGPRTLNRRAALPADVTKEQTLYVGRAASGAQGKWDSPYSVNTTLSRTSLVNIPSDIAPHWAYEGAYLNNAQVIALYALHLGVMLRNGERNIAELCYKDEHGEYSPYWTVCECAPKICHGDIVLTCGMFFAHASRAGIKTHVLQSAAADALLGLDYTKPGNILQQIRNALSERGNLMRQQEGQVDDVSRKAAAQAVATIKTKGGIWNTQQVRALCLKRLTSAIGLDGNARNSEWRISYMPFGVKIEVSEHLIDRTLRDATETLTDRGFLAKSAGDTHWKATVEH